MEYSGCCSRNISNVKIADYSYLEWPQILLETKKLTILICFRPEQKNFNPPGKNKGTFKKLFLTIKCHISPPRLSTLPLSGDFELVAFSLYYMYLYISICTCGVAAVKRKVKQW
jgi:hypothetical protein